MNWVNVKWILQREVRDQLRDRRTMFTIVVLPLVMYPLIGMAFLQITQFLQEHPVKVLVLHAGPLPQHPPLIANGHFHSTICPADEARLLEVEVSSADNLGRAPSAAQLQEAATRKVRAGEYDVVLLLPSDFADRLTDLRRRLSQRPEGPPPLTQSIVIAQPQLVINTASDRSRMARERVQRVLHDWREQLVQDSFQESNIPLEAAAPFSIGQQDVAEEGIRRAVLWSKVLPFVVLIWALTGAFYPAIDLCAGEKERGTLETLLSSPAGRGEIVWGKLLTIVVFSMATALLNLASMTFTATFILRQIDRMGTMSSEFQVGGPPLLALGWLVVALLPMSALFSALSLAIAAFARSSKEGQYYLMPLLLVMLPLMMLPMLPTTQLELGTALIPVTGMMLLVRTLVEGQFTEALLYLPPVLAVTAVCCALAIRWAIQQFQNEEVLFRESERWELKLWLWHLVRDRTAMPTFGQAMLCGVLILLIRFFTSFLVDMPENWVDMSVLVLVTQIAFIATPVLLMAIILTRRPRQTLLLSRPRALSIPAAVLLAVCLHPLALGMATLIRGLYPLSDHSLAAMEPFLQAILEAPLLTVLLVVAVTPAICEELAFRGFLLSGFRRCGHKWAAIALSSLFFAATHGILQQSLSAFVLGMVIGYVAIQTGSLWPCIAYHATHNGLSVLIGRLEAGTHAEYPWLQWFFHGTLEQSSFTYHPAWLLIGALAGGALLFWFHKLPYARYDEERIHEAIEHQTAAGWAWSRSGEHLTQSR